ARADSPASESNHYSTHPCESHQSCTQNGSRASNLSKKCALFCRESSGKTPQTGAEPRVGAPNRFLRTAASSCGAAHPISLSSSKKEERAGERRPFFVSFPSLQSLSPLVPRGERGENAFGVFHAEHNWPEARRHPSRRRSSLDAAVRNLEFLWLLEVGIWH